MRSISAKVTADISLFAKAMRSGGDEAGRFGKRVKDTARQANADLDAIDAQAKKLADQITNTKKAVDDLGLAFAKTGDTTLLKQRDQQQKLLSELKKAQSLVFDVRKSQDDGGKAGRAYMSAIKDAVSSAGDIFASTAMSLGKVIPPQVKVALLAGAIAAAPLVGAAVAGAVSGASGGLGIAGGMALAARDPRVKAEAGKVGKSILDDLTANAGDLGDELISSLNRFKAEIASLDAEFDRIFENSADFAGPLTDSLANAFGDVVEGLDNVIANAGPSMAAFGGGIELIGGEIKNFLDTVADNGDAGAKALWDLFTIAQLAIKQMTLLVDVFAKIYEYSQYIGSNFGILSTLSRLNAANSEVGDSANKAGEGTSILDRALQDVGSTATEVQHKFESMADAVARTVDTNLDAAEASLRLREAVAAAGKAVDGKRGVSMKEEQSLYALARAANAATEKLDAQGRTAEQAAASSAQQRRELIKAATAMGYSGTKAAELADQLLRIPKNVNPYVNLKIRNKALLDATREAIAQLPSRKDVQVAIRVTGNTNVSSVRSALDKQSANAYQRHGGVMTAMATGGSLSAGIYPASNPPLVKFAEPETGGELYLPRRGNPVRGRALVTEAAEWYGMTTTPMARGGVLAMASGGLVNVAPDSRSGRTGTRLDTAQSALSAYEAVTALNKALKENGRSFAISTTKGRENRSAVLSGVSAAKEAARAVFEQTGSVNAANKAYDGYIARLRRTLTAQKASTALLNQVAQRPSYDTGSAAPRNSSATIAYAQARMDLAGAQDKAAAFFDPSWGKPRFDTSSAAGRDGLTALFEFLASAEAQAQARYRAGASASVATASYNQSLTALRGILARSGLSKKEIDSLLTSYGRITLSNRYGGVYQHAQQGVLRDAHIAAGGPTQYAYAEPATGGELFAPKNGNLAKTRSEVGWAVQNWWGGNVTWQPGTGRSPAVAAAPGGGITLRVVVDDGAVAGLVRVEVDEAFGALADASVYSTT